MSAASATRCMGRVRIPSGSRDPLNLCHAAGTLRLHPLPIPLAGSSMGLICMLRLALLLPTRVAPTWKPETKPRRQSAKVLAGRTRSAIPSTTTLACKSASCSIADSIAIRLRRGLPSALAYTSGRQRLRFAGRLANGVRVPTAAQTRPDRHQKFSWDSTVRACHTRQIKPTRDAMVSGGALSSFASQPVRPTLAQISVRQTELVLPVCSCLIPACVTCLMAMSAASWWMSRPFHGRHIFPARPQLLSEWRRDPFPPSRSTPRALSHRDARCFARILTVRLWTSSRVSGTAPHLTPYFPALTLYTSLTCNDCPH